MGADNEIRAQPQEIEASSWLGLVPGTVLDDKYKIDSRLGEGGMCFVFKAEHLALKRTAAIKLLKPRLLASKNALARFMQEAKTLCELKHPHIVEIFSIGTYEQSPYVALEYLDGVSLAELLDQQADRKLPLERAIPIFVQICDALAFAHSKGVIHRDLKPSNVVVLLGDQVKLVDFGIAKLLDAAGAPSQKLTQSGSVIGTPQYMSPEQCLGANLDARSDLYSMGCLMHEVLTGAPPFTGDNNFALLNKHVNKTVPVGLSGGDPILRIIAQTLDKDPNKRPQSAADLKQLVQNPPPKKSRWQTPVIVAICLAVGITAAVNFITSHPTPSSGSDQKISDTGGETFNTYDGAMRQGIAWLTQEQHHKAAMAFQTAEHLIAKEPSNRERKICRLRAYQARLILYSKQTSMFPRAAELDKYVINSPVTGIDDVKLIAFKDVQSVEQDHLNDEFRMAKQYLDLANRNGSREDQMFANLCLGQALCYLRRHSAALETLQLARKLATNDQAAVSIIMLTGQNYHLWSDLESGRDRTKHRAAAIQAFRDVTAFHFPVGSISDQTCMKAKKELAEMLNQP
jgi:tRNA A-37 threonylcarbamoyl transferase component Bud32